MEIVTLELSLGDDDDHHDIFSGIFSAKETCIAILNFFQHNTLLNQLATKWKLYTVTAAAEEKILQYVNRVNHLSGTLSSINGNVDDSQVSNAVLY